MSWHGGKEAARKTKNEAVMQGEGGKQAKGVRKRKQRRHVEAGRQGRLRRGCQKEGGRHGR
jgi:hypothetical protein